MCVRVNIVVPGCSAFSAWQAVGEDEGSWDPFSKGGSHPELGWSIDRDDTLPFQLLLEGLQYT